MKLKLKLLLLLLFILNHHVDSGSIVKFLPGFEGPLPFELETGYIGIGEKEEVQSFYYFIMSENNPKEDPLLLWLSGGPGCSSITGLLFENGPLALKSEVYNGSVPSLVSTTYSWTKTANIIFLDQPIGAGFSYSRTPLIDTPTDTGEVKNIHEFLQKWLSKHPQFSSNPFYACGDSYSGMIVPALVQEISKGNYICCTPPINLQGYILGNPITSIEDQNYQVPFSHGMALISDELYESIRRACNGNYFNVDSRNTKCLKLVEEYHKCTDKLNEFNILSPDCDTTSPNCFGESNSSLGVSPFSKAFSATRPHMLGPRNIFLRLLLQLYPYYLLSYWINDESVRNALHVNKWSIGEWERCTYRRPIPYNKDINNSIPYHMNNSISGYRSLIYSGDHDLTVPYLATQAWIKSLNYSIIHEWRPWMIKDQIAGYTRTYSNKMTFATVKGSGHTAEYKPNETFIMFQRWINGQPL